MPYRACYFRRDFYGISLIEKHTLYGVGNGSYAFLAHLNTYV